MRVQATRAGFYNGQLRPAGSIFDLLQDSDFSDSTVNLTAASPARVVGWMVRADGSPLTPLGSQFGVYAPASEGTAHELPT
jgi:hypothetical protein